MFYPVEYDVHDHGPIKQRHRGVEPAPNPSGCWPRPWSRFPRSRTPTKTATCLSPPARSSAFALEELTGEKLEPHCYCIGMVAGVHAHHQASKTTARRPASSPRASA